MVLFHGVHAAVIACVVACLSALPAASAAAPLSLAEAERLALRDDPGRARYRALAAELQENAVADRQWPDPQLRVGIGEVPLDDFDIQEHEDTELQIGLSQSFGRGSSLELQGQRSEALARVEDAMGADRTRLVVRTVRLSFLDRYLHTQGIALLQQAREVLEQLAAITEAQYGVGREIQADVVQAQLELSLLDDRLAVMESDEQAAAAELARWIGSAAAMRPLTAEFPELPAPPALEGLEPVLMQHPRVQADTAEIDASRRSVAIAHEQYKPAFGIDLMLGDNTAEDFDLQTGPDFASVMLTMDLPLFPGKRQDRRLAASEQREMAATYARDDLVRELRGQAARNTVVWQRLGERLARFDKQVLPQAEQATNAVLKAYQVGLSDFTTLMRSRERELDARLELLRLRVERAKAQAELLYLAGEQP